MVATYFRENATINWRFVIIYTIKYQNVDRILTENYNFVFGSQKFKNLFFRLDIKQKIF